MRPDRKGIKTNCCPTDNNSVLVEMRPDRKGIKTEPGCLVNDPPGG